MFDSVWGIFTNNYITSPVWLVLTVASLIYLVVRSASEMRKKFLLIVFLSLLTIFNDFGLHFLAKMFNMSAYYRFFWLLPYGMVVAYAVMRIILDIYDMSSDESIFHEVGKRNKTAVILFICISLGGILFVTQENYIRNLKNAFPTNQYQVSDDVLQVKWLLDKERAVGRAEELPVLACDLMLMMQYQTIDAGCIIVTNRDLYLDFKTAYPDKWLLSTICEDNAQPDVMQAKAALIREEVDYIIVHAGAGMEGYMESLDCSLVGQTTSYLLYRVNDGNTAPKKGTSWTENED